MYEACWVVSQASPLHWLAKLLVGCEGSSRWGSEFYDNGHLSCQVPDVSQLFRRASNVVATYERQTGSEGERGQSPSPQQQPADSSDRDKKQ